MLHIGAPLTTGLFEGEGHVIAEANVATIVEAAGGTGGAGADCCGGHGRLGGGE